MTSQLFYEMTSNSCLGPHVCYVLGIALGYKKTIHLKKVKKRIGYIEIRRFFITLVHLSALLKNLLGWLPMTSTSYLLVVVLSFILPHVPYSQYLCLWNYPFVSAAYPISTWLCPVNTIIAHHDFLLTVKFYLLGNVLSTWTTVNFDCLKNVLWWTNPNNFDSYQLSNPLLLAHTDSHTYIRTKMT